MAPATKRALTAGNAQKAATKRSKVASENSAGQRGAFEWADDSGPDDAPEEENLRADFGPPAVVAVQMNTSLGGLVMWVCCPHPGPDICLLTRQAQSLPAECLIQGSKQLRLLASFAKLCLWLLRDRHIMDSVGSCCADGCLQDSVDFFAASARTYILIRSEWLLRVDCKPSNLCSRSGFFLVAWLQALEKFRRERKSRRQNESIEPLWQSCAQLVAVQAN